MKKVKTVGDKIWSNYFGDWLIITKIVSDEEWYCVPLRSLDRLQMKAKTPLSKMPKKI